MERGEREGREEGRRHGEEGVEVEEGEEGRRHLEELRGWCWGCMHACYTVNKQFTIFHSQYIILSSHRIVPQSWTLTLASSTAQPTDHHTQHITKHTHTLIHVHNTHGCVNPHRR